MSDQRVTKELPTTPEQRRRTIIRRRVTHNFTVLTNQVFDDPRLSAEALGVLCYLLSRPDNWHVSTRQLRNRFSVGRDKMLRIMSELIRDGWMQRELLRNEHGVWAGSEYIVRDFPNL